MSYLLPSKTFLVMSVAIGIRHSVFHNSTFHMLDYFTDDRLLALKVFTCLRKSYLSSTVGQTRLSITIINIERPCANCILQESMDWINDIFGKRKRKIFSFLGTWILDPICTYFNYFVTLRSEDWVNSLNYVVILYKQRCVGFHILFRCNRLMVKKSFLKNLC